MNRCGGDISAICLHKRGFSVSVYRIVKIGNQKYEITINPQIHHHSLGLNKLESKFAQIYEQLDSNIIKNEIEHIRY